MVARVVREPFQLQRDRALASAAPVVPSVAASALSATDAWAVAMREIVESPAAVSIWLARRSPVRDRPVGLPRCRDAGSRSAISRCRTSSPAHWNRKCPGLDITPAWQPGPPATPREKPRHPRTPQPFAHGREQPRAGTGSSPRVSSQGTSPFLLPDLALEQVRLRSMRRERRVSPGGGGSCGPPQSVLTAS
jgi:hypothetical protein